MLWLLLVQQLDKSAIQEFQIQHGQVLLNFEAEAEGRGADEIVKNILETVPTAAADFATR
jgi:hypothetical protein